MLYRPNFCCNCGEKIERVEWNLLTSRRFCVVCSSENKAHDILPRVAVAAGALALMFGFGSLWTGFGGAAARTAEPANGMMSLTPQTAAAQPKITQAASSINEARDAVPPAQSIVPAQPVGADSTSAAGDGKPVAYSCGARTKKGTPCSRKVKGKGMRCFQHEGRPEAPNSE